MEKSDSIIELAKALNKAQAEFKPAKKSGFNPFHKNKYSDLSDIIDSIRNPLAKYGLSYCQFPIGNNNEYGVETILMHSSGEWLSEKIMLKPKEINPQAAGSAISYARRYALQGILGIPTEDDDANSATSLNKNKNQSKQMDEPKQEPKPQETIPDIVTVNWITACNDIKELSNAFNKLPDKNGDLAEMIKSKIELLRKEATNK